MCLHAGNAREEVEMLVSGMVEWARAWMRKSIEAGDAKTEVDDAVQAKL